MEICEGVRLWWRGLERQGRSRFPPWRSSVGPALWARPAPSGPSPALLALTPLLLAPPTSDQLFPLELPRANPYSRAFPTEPFL